MMRWSCIAVSFLLAFNGLSIAGAVDDLDPTLHLIGTPPDHSVRPISFSRDVVPALTRAGCNAGVCHGSFQGRGGLQLSLLGFDAQFDFEVLTKASRGRRIQVAAPEQSLLLLKPTGAMPHGGGRRISPDSEVASILRHWLLAGTPGPRDNDLTGLKLRVEPPELTLEARPLVVAADQPRPKGPGAALRVTATYADGSTHDVTPWSMYETRDKSIAEVSRSGGVTALRSGKTSVSVRYLGQVASISVTVPYGAKRDFEFPARNEIDEIVAEEWKKLGVVPAEVCDDPAFLRRVFIDLIGTLPTVDEVRKFMADAAPDKRARLIDELLTRPEYDDFWSLKWGDLLRAHRRYLGEKGLASFNGWIRQSVRDNKPLDVMTRELLTAKGNLFTNGPVAYYFIDEKVEDLAETTSQVFLGIRLQCTKCHHHPNEVWSQQDYYGLAAFFSKLEIKDSGAHGARFGGPKSIRPSATENANRKPQMAVAAKVLDTVAWRQPDATPVNTASPVDPREQLADWITRPDNPYFARNFANRTWAALFKTGLVDPVDDLRATNPAMFPRLLDSLAEDLADHKFDPKHLLRKICNSRVYQLATERSAERDLDGVLLTHQIPRRLSAEVLLDAINQVLGTTEKFPGQPPGTRAIALPDPTIASHFLSTFGRPERNSACDCSRSADSNLSQALQLINSSFLGDKIAAPTGRLPDLLNSKRTDDEILDELYLAATARPPTEEVRRSVHEFLGSATQRNEAWQDVLWAILNCREFLFHL